MHSYKSFVTILQSYINIDRAVSEELRSQDFLIVHYSEKCPITPTKYVESKWGYSMHIYTSCVTILQSFIKVGQAFLEEMCSQSYSDGRTEGRTDERRPLLCHSVASLRGTRRIYGLNIYVYSNQK